MSCIRKGSLVRKVLFHLAVSCIGVLLAALLCLLLGERLVKYTDDADRLSFMRKYYNRVNAHGTGDYEVENICVVNLHEKGPDDSLIRYRAARAIERLSAFNPRVIGVDIRFKGLHNKKEDVYLENTILKYRERIVVSRSMYEEEKRSYFDTDSAGLKYGYANIGDFYSKASSYEPSFAKAVLVEAGLYDESFERKHRILDFSNVQIMPIDAETLFDMADETVARLVDHKIVILADTQDEKDIINLPFLIGNQEWMPGAFYHVYCMNSMQKGGPVFIENSWLSILLCLLLAFVYSVIAGAISSWIKKVKNNSGNKNHVLALLVLKPILLSLIWVLIPFIMRYFVTYRLRVAPNLVLAMVSVSLIIIFFENFIDELKDRLT